MSKTVVITGGGGVLCATLAKAFAKQGYQIALLDLRKQAAQEVAQQINGKGGNAMALEVNVLDKTSLEAARKQITEQFGPCDILINGAGGNHPKGTTSDEFLTVTQPPQDQEGYQRFFDLEPAAIEFVFGLNFMGTFIPTQVFSQDMVGRSSCSILNISSMNAFTPLTKIPAYSAAKAAVSNFTQWLAVYFAKVEIRVNALAPGFFLTDQNRALLLKPTAELTSRGASILTQTPMGRFGQPEDLASTALWLSDAEGAAFITGIVVPIDGGFSAFSGV